MITTEKQVKKSDVSRDDDRKQRAAFWSVAYLLAVMLLGSTLPTPLYRVYQNQWHFSSAILTFIFSVYGAGVVVSLILFGRLSDQMGRRPILLVAVVLSALHALLFLFAQGIGEVLVARLVQGVAVGLVNGAASAALSELDGRFGKPRAALVSSVAIIGGLALGPLLSGVLIQYAPWPTVLVYSVYVICLVPAFYGVWSMPEPVRGTKMVFSWHPQKLAIPRAIRRPFLIASSTVFCSFALMGLFGGLGPSFLTDLLHVQNKAIGGGAVFLLFAMSTGTQLVARRVLYSHAIVSGLFLVTLGLSSIVVAIPFHSLPLFFIGLLCGGVGQGLAFLGSISLLNRIVLKDRRSEVFSAYYVLSYIGMTLPVLGTGIEVRYVGLYLSLVTFAIVIGLSAGALAAFLAMSQSGKTTIDPRL